MKAKNRQGEVEGGQHEWQAAGGGAGGEWRLLQSLRHRRLCRRNQACLWAWLAAWEQVAQNWRKLHEICTDFQINISTLGALTDFLLHEFDFHLQHHPHPQSSILGRRLRWRFREHLSFGRDFMKNIQVYSRASDQESCGWWRAIVKMIKV